jgi:protein O-GlcNAc transferase
VALKPEDANARSNLGLFLADAGRTDEAVEQLTQAVQIEPQNATAQYNLGLAYTKADALEEAARAYLGALGQRESFPQAHHNLAVILIGLGICQESKRHLDRSHELGIKSAPIVLKQYQAICEPPEESPAQEGGASGGEKPAN